MHFVLCFMLFIAWVFNAAFLRETETDDGFYNDYLYIFIEQLFHIRIKLNSYFCYGCGRLAQVTFSKYYI